jgi:aspartyl-tRNA(Asn)/glutamyl-tRNA(Gln) amidotransferase subunit C
VAVSNDEVKYIARLAKLNFREEELEKFTKHFNEILSYMDTLNELDTENIEPLTHPVDSENVFREDIPWKGSSRDDAMKNSPQTDGEYFMVPKIINPAKK